LKRRWKESTLKQLLIIAVVATVFTSACAEETEYDCLTVDGAQVCRPVDECTVCQDCRSIDYGSGAIAIYTVTDNPYEHLAMVEGMLTMMWDLIEHEETVSGGVWHYDIYDVDNDEADTQMVLGQHVTALRDDTDEIIGTMYVGFFGLWYDTDRETLERLTTAFAESIEPAE
jgi:hypothetical protein